MLLLGDLASKSSNSSYNKMAFHIFVFIISLALINVDAFGNRHDGHGDFMGFDNAFVHDRE